MSRYLACSYRKIHGAGLLRNVDRQPLVQQFTAGETQFGSPVDVADAEDGSRIGAAQFQRADLLLSKRYYNAQPFRNCGVSIAVASELFVNRIACESHFSSVPSRRTAMSPTKAISLSGPP